MDEVPEPCTAVNKNYLSDLFNECDNMLDIGFDQLDLGIGDFSVAF